MNPETLELKGHRFPHKLARKGDLYLDCDCGNMVCPRYDNFLRQAVEIDERMRKTYTKKNETRCSRCGKFYSTEDLKEVSENKKFKIFQ